ncbi:MAG: ABC transporter permease [Lachnospiraceae bacterium]|jgi:ABC-type dipeptide/oligopeptide/nickel transport system permease component|nr:ABC transporter permease [Lachnospiraceae bacterium]
MGRYILHRLLIAIPTVIGVFLAVFLIMRMVPGDPAAIILGKNATDEQIELYREQNGLNEPFPVQIGVALGKFLTGDLGTSMVSRRTVISLIKERLPRTVELALWGLGLSTLVGVLLGILAAVTRGKWPDYLIVGGASLGISLPSFYIALMLLLLLGAKLGWIPVVGTPREGVSNFKILIAPVLTMVIGNSAMTLRTTRSSVLEIMRENFIKTARAKGLDERAVLFGHALKAAAIPIVTVVGYNLAGCFGGAIIIETVFTRPGIGKLLIDAINDRDYAVVQGTTAFISIMLIAVNLLTDVVYGLVDPRIRIEAKRG